MKEKKQYEIEIREGDRYFGFYSRETGKWISGCKKPYLLDVMVELTNRFYDLYGKEAFFVIGGYEDDASLIKRIRYGSAGSSALR